MAEETPGPVHVVVDETPEPVRSGDTAPVLAMRDLNVYYGAIHALRGLSVHVNQGEIVTLIGANGAGKSTLLRTISGLVV